MTELNPEQLKAVLHIGTPVRVLSVAGSGKTLTFCHRIVYLVNTLGLMPESILALTFARKAAEEMAERLKALVGEELVSRIALGTIHSLGYRILKAERDAIPCLREGFRIINDKEKVSILRRIISRGEPPLQMDIGCAIRRISLAKNDLMTAEIFTEVQKENEEKELAAVYQLYDAAKERRGLLDFDDLLLKPYWLLIANTSLLEKYQRRFSHILVDEYQDVSLAMVELVREISLPKGNVWVAGDDDQAIHSFRGARVEHILDFPKRYAGALTIQLEINYRSSGRICKAAEKLINCNSRRVSKRLVTPNPEGEAIDVIECFDEEDEARQVGSKILFLNKEHGIVFSSAAVLYRTNCQSRPLEDEFNRRAIPYQVVGSRSFYARKEVQTVLAFLRLIQNPSDPESLQRVLVLPHCSSNKDFLPLIVKHLHAHCTSSPEYLVSEVRDVLGLEKFLSGSDMHAEDNSVVQNLNQLEQVASTFESLDEFLAHVRRVSTRTEEEGSNGVQLMSIHRAKGLQWHVVFVVGCSEGILPHYNALEGDGSIEALEEERRLMYVAMTRAEQRLFISWLKSFNGKPRSISRFIEEALAESESEKGGGS